MIWMSTRSKALWTPRHCVIGKSSSTWSNERIDHINIIPRSQWSIWKAIWTFYEQYPGKAHPGGYAHWPPSLQELAQLLGEGNVTVLGQNKILRSSITCQKFSWLLWTFGCVAGGAQHMVTGLGLILPLYKPHYPIFFHFFFFFFTLCLVFRTQLKPSIPSYFCF